MTCEQYKNIANYARFLQQTDGLVQKEEIANFHNLMHYSLHNKVGNAAILDVSSATPPGSARGSSTHLEAHAAVRIDELSGKGYDCCGLPVRRPGRERAGRFSVARSIKGLASYLTTRINPSYQECLVRVVDTLGELRLEVRQLSTGRGTVGRVVFTASFSALVDVSRDSVIEKDTVVFSQLPSSFQPMVENSSFISPIEEAKYPHSSSSAPVSKGEELISTLFSAYGDIGLNLVFYTAADASIPNRSSNSGNNDCGGRAARLYTKIGIRFVSTAERNEWMSFCAEAYGALLLDAIRSGRHTVFNVHPNAASAQLGSAAALSKPSEEYIERYIDIFLSTNGRTEPAVEPRSSATVSLVAPLGGVLQVLDGSGVGHRCEVQLRREEVADISGLMEPHDYLIFTRGHWRRRQETQRILLTSIKVYADDDQSGCIFYLDFPRSSHLPPVASDGAVRVDSVEAVQQSFLSADELLRAREVVTLECDAGSFANRRLWIQWLERITQKPVIYLSSVRREMEKQVSKGQYSRNGLFGDRGAW